MRSIINRKHILEPGMWVLSIVRRKDQNQDHAFIVLESVNDKDERILIEGHLAYKELSDDEIDQRKAQINYPVNKSPEQIARRASQELICRSWDITDADKKKLEEKIYADQKKEIIYQALGKTKTSGFFGASLDASGANNLKDSSVDSNEKSLKDKGSSAFVAYASIDATLRHGHNCVSWAIEAINYIISDFEGTELGKYIAFIPALELPASKKINF